MGTPKLTAVNHLSLPVRDLDEAVRFWTTIFGAEIIFVNHDVHFGEVRVAGVILGLGETTGGWTGPSAEYPHWGFTVEPEFMRPLQQKLQEYGVPTNEIWTRRQVESLMYFRDPSGNLFEFYCPSGFADVLSIPVGVFGGGTYEVDLEALNYDSWKDPK